MSDLSVRIAPRLKTTIKHSSAHQRHAAKPRKRKAWDPPAPDKRRQAQRIEDLRNAKLALGYKVGAAPAAEVFGLGRSTLWAIFNSRHKRSGLSGKTVKRMLSAEKMPKRVRKILEQYL